MTFQVATVIVWHGGWAAFPANPAVRLRKNIRESTNGLTMHLLLDLSRLLLGKPLPVHFQPLAVVAEILEN